MGTDRQFVSSDYKNRQGFDWANPSSLKEILATSDKQRFEMKAGSIRALYGHSLPQQRIHKPAKSPPEILYHGTTPKAAQQIAATGLDPVSRQYVHLSIDIATANIVARHRTQTPVILRVHAAMAFAQGIQFYKGNAHIWLSDPIPADYIENYNTG